MRGLALKGWMPTITIIVLLVLKGKNWFEILKTLWSFISLAIKNEGTRL